MRRLTYLMALLLVSIIGLSSITPIFADVVPTLSPVKTVLNLNPGDSKQVTIILHDNSPSPQALNAIFNDFTADEDLSGNPKLLPGGTTDPHGLSAWLTGATTVTIPTNDSTTYVINISVPQKAATGSYYAVAKFTGSSDANSQSVATILFVNVGSIQSQLSVSDFKIVTSTADALTPTINATLKNSGNGYVVPKLTVAVQDSQKHTIETVELNAAQGGVLPDSSRKFAKQLTKSLDKTQDYTLVLKATAESGKAVTAQTTIKATVVPLKPKSNTKELVAAALGVVVIILGLVFIVLKLIRQPKVVQPVAVPSAVVPTTQTMIAPQPPQAPIQPQESVGQQQTPLQPPAQPQVADSQQQPPPDPNSTPSQ